MLFSTKGIVLQAIKYGDSSLISSVFTEEKGLMSFISNNLKGKKNKTKNYLQPLSVVQLVCTLSKKSNIHRLKEISFANDKQYINDNVSISAIRFFIAEFLSKTIKEEEQNLSLFQFLENKIEELYSSSILKGSFHIIFLVELFDLLGIQPILNEKDLYFDYIEGCSTSSKPMHENYCNNDLFLLLINADNGKISSKKTERTKLLNLIITYYNIQLGGGLENLKSKVVLETVFN